MRGTGFMEEMRSLKMREVAGRRAAAPDSALEAWVAGMPPPPDFVKAVRAEKGERPRIIGEVKRASPSAGEIRPGFDPVYLAGRLAAGGVSAISVLTEERFFRGSLDDLDRVARAVGLPVLRKDFVLDRYQLLEARARGASAVLLIAAFLEAGGLVRLAREARDLGLSPLVEIRDERELENALDSRAEIIGINNRDLATMEVDIAATLRIAPLAPPGCVLVSESGFRSKSDLERLAGTGISAVLVGEAFMRAEDPAEAVRAFRGEI